MAGAAAGAGAARARAVLERHVRPSARRAHWPLEVTGTEVHGEPISRAEAEARAFEPLSVGSEWGRRWGTAWWRLRARLPREWLEVPLALALEVGHRGAPGFGAEALVYHDGSPIAGVDVRHSLVRLGPEVVGRDGAVELLVEAAANPAYPSEMWEWPSLDPDPNGPPMLRLERAELVWLDLEVLELVADCELACELVEQGDPGSPRARELDGVLGGVAAFLAARLPAAEPAGTSAIVEAARTRLGPALSLRAEGGAGQIVAVGHAHIDTAWLWPMREARRKVARTVATAVSLAEGDPAYHFVLSQALHHAWLASDHPALFARLRRLVEEGRIEPLAAMWVEADVNLPSGESLVRQLLWGRRTSRSFYGIEPDILWLPDAFGYPACLPTLLRAAGIRGFVTQKLSWNDTNTFPAHTFVWEGLDGSTVLAHFPPAATYNGDCSVAELRRALADYHEAGLGLPALYPFGFGDGGGGPTPEMLARLRRVVDCAGLPRTTQGSVSGFFDALEARVVALSGEGRALPSWAGPLYLEYHRGTFTSQARTKAGNRAAEAALFALELWSILAPSEAPPEPGGRALGAEIEALWELVLPQQFHDVLPGSSIGRVHAEAVDAFAHVVTRAGELGRGLLRQGCSPGEGPDEGPEDARRPEGRVEPRFVLVASPAPVLRPVVVDLGPALGASRAWRLGPTARGAGGPGVDPIPTQQSATGHLLAELEVPAAGWCTVVLDDGPVEASPLADRPGRGDEPVVSGPSARRARAVADADGARLENEHLCARFDAAGRLVSLAGRGGDWAGLASCEVLSAARPANALRLVVDEPLAYDAWELDPPGTQHEEWLTDWGPPVVVEPGPLRASLRFSASLGRSAFVLTVTVDRSSPALACSLDVDWRERHRLARLDVPVGFRALRATLGTQLGLLEQSPRPSTSWERARFEQCAHGFVDLSDAAHGLSVLAPAKYGWQVGDGLLSLSLLRAPSAPDPGADQGPQHVDYQLWPHAGDLRDAGIPEAAAYAALATEVLVLEAPPLRPTCSLVGLDQPGVVVTAVRRAEDGPGVVVRLHEAWGRSVGVRVRLASHLGLRHAWRADLAGVPVEGADDPDIEGAARVDLGSFALATLRFGP